MEGYIYCLNYILSEVYFVEVFFSKKLNESFFRQNTVLTKHGSIQDICDVDKKNNIIYE
jgi:hypothetical protein